MNEFYKIITGQDILTLSSLKTEPLIEDFIFENDYILLVAEEKAGKTIFAQQVACALTSGKPLFNTLEVPKPVNVWYFATEGKEEDLKDRFIRMSHGIPFDPARLLLIPSRFRFNTSNGRECLRDLINTNKDRLPKVIIIDALYRAVKGSIKDDEVVNEFHHIIGWLSHECDSAVLIVHHMRKPMRDVDGKYISRTDEDTFGSAFLKAAVDHCFWLERCIKDPKDRVLKCDTQRSGNIVDNIRLKLVEPDPLYFDAVSHRAEERHQVTTLLKTFKGGMTMKQLVEHCPTGRAVLYKVMKELVDEKVVSKVGTKNKVFVLN